MKAYTEQSYYELLEVAPSATIEEIVAAYQRAVRLYDAESVALYPVGDPGQVEELKKLLLEAVEILSDPELRLEYDKGLGISSSAQVSREGPPVATQASAQNPQALRNEAHRPEASGPSGTEGTLAGRGSPAPEPQPVPAIDAQLQLATPHRPPAAQRPHSTAPGYAISYLPKGAPPAGRAPSLRSNESGAASRASLGPPTAAGPELRSLAPALPLPAGTDGSPAPVRWPHPSFQGSRANPSPANGPDHPTPVATPRTSPPQPAGIPKGLTAPAAPNGESPQDASRPGTPRRALESAPVLAQEAAIADAESALALVQAQIAQRTREARPRGIDIPPDAVFNGELLRHVRKARGMSVQVLAERTRISPRHIENLEADRYDALPATVYLRGIVMNIARELGLDPLRVSKGYLALVEKPLGRR